MFIPGKPLIQAKDFLKLFSSDISDVHQTTSNIFYYSNGREALFNGLRALPSSKSNMVWMPAYICKSVVDSVRRAGFNPAFYDVDRELKPLWDIISPAPGDTLLLVHYFGIQQESDVIDRIKRRCNEHSFFVVEDNAHSLPYVFSGKNDIKSDITFFSLRKTLAVPDGGILVLNNLIKPDNTRLRPVDISMKKWLFMITEKVAFLLQLNITDIKKYVRDVWSHELMSEGRSAISRQTLSLLKMSDLEKISKKNLNNYHALASRLTDIKNIFIPFKDLPAGSAPLVFPLWCQNATATVGKLRKAGIEAFLWPGREQPPNINLNEFPGTHEWIKKGVMLPVHHSLKEGHLEKIAHELKRAT